MPTTGALADLAQKLTGLNPLGLGDIASPPASNKPGSFCTTTADGTFTIYLKDGAGVTFQSSDVDAPGGVTTFNTRSGAVTLTAGDLTALITILGAADGTAVIGGTALAPTVRVNVGTGNNQVVQLDGSSKLPAVDGSQLTNLPGGTLNVPIAKTTTYLMVAKDSVVLANGTGGAFTVTLPVSPTAGQRYSVKKTDASINAITVVGSAGNIDGASTASLVTQYQSIDAVWDSANWWVV